MLNLQTFWRFSHIKDMNVSNPRSIIAISESPGWKPYEAREKHSIYGFVQVNADHIG